MNRHQRRQEARSGGWAKRGGDASIIGLFERGLAHHRAGRLQKAQAVYRHILTFNPAHADAHNHLGIALWALGQPAEAEASYREALRLRPNWPEAHYNLGAVLWALGRRDEAEVSYHEALRLRPDYPEAHTDLGAALWALGRRDEAEASYREAVRLRPNSPGAHCNLGDALYVVGRPAEAEASYREALRLRPNYPETHTNLGAALTALGRLAEAEASHREALRLRPDYPEAHYNLAHTLLGAGRLEEGWKEWEWRWKSSTFPHSARDFSAPLWKGEPIGDRTILLHAEQALGDTLQFCRYAPLTVCGGGIILEVQAPLLPVVSRLPGVMQFVARGDRLPPFDLHCPLQSLPLAFGTTLDTIPAAPYLRADPVLAASWQERLAGRDGLRIGLVWASGAWLDFPEIARRKSIALKALAPLAEISGVSFVSLQKPLPPSDVTSLSLFPGLSDIAGDFAETAAMIMNLDLVITVDTSIGHLAGALGRPVWFLLSKPADWRWMIDRSDSPWYPTARLFRQKIPGDWNSVIAEATVALAELRAMAPQGLPPTEPLCASTPTPTMPPKLEQRTTGATDESMH